jgi:hypothetical protein
VTRCRGLVVTLLRYSVCDIDVGNMLGGIDVFSKVLYSVTLYSKVVSHILNFISEIC